MPYFCNAFSSGCSRLDCTIKHIRLWAWAGAYTPTLVIGLQPELPTTKGVFLCLKMSNLLNQLRAERLQAETQINELRQMEKLSPILRTVSLIEIDRRISELEQFLLDTEDCITMSEKTEALFSEFLEKIKCEQ